MEALKKLLLELFAIIPKAIAAALEVAPLLAQATNALKSSTDPTDEQWQAVDDQIKALQAQLNMDPPAPLGGDPPPAA